MPVSARSADLFCRERTTTFRGPRWTWLELPGRPTARHGRRLAIRLGREVRVDAHRSHGRLRLREWSGCLCCGAGLQRRDRFVSPPAPTLMRSDPNVPGAVPAFVRAGPCGHHQSPARGLTLERPKRGSARPASFSHTRRMLGAFPWQHCEPTLLARARRRIAARRSAVGRVAVAVRGAEVGFRPRAT